MNARLLAAGCLLGFVLACSGPSPSGEAPAAEEEPAERPAQEPAQPARSRKGASLFYRKEASGAPDFSTWAPGDLLWLGVDIANLRATPSAEGEIAATLPMGAELTVIEAGAEVQTVLDRTNRWYRVESKEHKAREGYLFGSLLTPQLFRADPDGDGEEEVISITFSPDFKPRIRVMEPAIPEDDDRVVGLDLEMPKLTRGGWLTAEVLSSPQDPFALVKVTLCDEGTCRSRLVSYLRSGSAALGEIYEIPGDPDKLAFVTGGFSLGAATFRRTGARFSDAPCPECSGLEQLVLEPRELLFSLELESEARGPNTDVPCSRIGRIAGGDYRGKSVVSCVITFPGKMGPDTLGPERFIELSPSSYAYLGQGPLYSDLRPLLEGQGVAIESAPGVRLRGLEAPPTLSEGQWGQVVRRHHATAFDGAGNEVLFDHPVAGPVYSAREGDGALYVPQPDGGALLYSYKLPDWPEGPGDPRAGRRYSPELRDCGGAATTHLQLASVRESDLVPFAKTPAGEPLYKLADQSHRIATDLYALYQGYERGGTDKELMSEEAFLSSLPLFLWRDPFGRFIVFLRDDLQTPNFCEPVLYLYGAREPITVTLGEEISVTRAAPPGGGAWTLIPSGDGGVIDPETGRSWPYLFWEGRNGLFPRPSSGVVLERAQVVSYLEGALLQMGLRGREIDDFLTTWAPILEGAAPVRVSFHDRDTIDRLVPMQIEPDPDTLVRILLEYESVQSVPARQSLPALPGAPARRGLTVIEWGVVVR